MMSVQVGLKLRTPGRGENLRKCFSGLLSRSLLVSVFGLGTLITGCGDESEPGSNDTASLSTTVGSAGTFATTGANEQGPGGVPTGTMPGVTTGSTPGVTTGTTPGATTGGLPGTTTGAGTTNSTGATSSTSSTDDTGSSSTTTTTTTTDTGNDTSSTSGETSSDAGEATEPDPGPKPRKRYTEGHGDLYVGYNKKTDQADVYIRLQRSILDGTEVSGEYPVDDIVLVGAGRKMRELEDVDGILKGMCVEPGESIWWLPRAGGDSAALKVPFFGWGSAVRPLDLVKPVTIRVLGFNPPSPAGHFSVWKNETGGVFPKFFVSTCDGLEGDAFAVEAGHDHMDLGFSGAPGLWSVHFRAEFSLKTTEKDYSKDFTIQFLIQDP